MDYMGASDSAAGLHIRSILADIQPRTLIVERPIGEVLGSLRMFLGYEVRDAAERLERLQEALTFDHPLIKRIAYRDLNDRDALSEAVDWLVPSLSWRARSMMNMNIQVDRDHAIELARRPHSGWHMREAA
jgi:hypothetical protein